MQGGEPTLYIFVTSFGSSPQILEGLGCNRGGIPDKLEVWKSQDFSKGGSDEGKPFKVNSRKKGKT